VLAADRGDLQQLGRLLDEQGDQHALQHLVHAAAVRGDVAELQRLVDEQDSEEARHHLARLAERSPH
jgi:hypothetical protein